MPLFSYTARRRDGSPAQGTVDGVSLQAARASLQQMGLEVLELNEQSAPSVASGLDAVSPDWNASEPAPSPLPVNMPELFTRPAPPPPAPPPPGTQYFPLMDTFRLYAGWLLAWYFLIFSFGSYQFLQKSPLRIPYLTELFLSPILLTFAFGAFLFLLASTVHRLVGKGLITGLILTAMWGGVVYVFQMNT